MHWVSHILVEQIILWQLSYWWHNYQLNMLHKWVLVLRVLSLLYSLIKWVWLATVTECAHTWRGVGVDLCWMVSSSFSASAIPTFPKHLLNAFHFTCIKEVTRCITYTKPQMMATHQTSFAYQKYLPVGLVLELGPCSGGSRPTSCRWQLP